MTVQRIMYLDSPEGVAFLAQLEADLEYHETHKPEPAPWKGKVLERLIAQEGK